MFEMSNADAIFDWYSKCGEFVRQTAKPISNQFSVFFRKNYCDVLGKDSMIREELTSLLNLSKIDIKQRSR